MKITKEFILENKTDNGSWTRSQMQALGLKWPLEAGWKTRVIGLEISDENVEIFKSKIPAKPKKISRKRLRGILNRRKTLSNQELNSALKKIKGEILNR